ncbi:MAG: DUF2784 domain-containing protein [Pseudodesulfovibrio sp.]|nr:DUF2784 domain-containing protein [Pseudodesulfovibrio sp.]
MADGQMMLLADGVLVIHFCIAAYLVLGLPLIWIGRCADWRSVRDPWFRYSHLGLMGFVFLESVVGRMCPLTVWEGALRRAAGQARTGRGESFVGHWMGKLLFCDFDETWFTAAYGVFFLALVVTLWLVPVRRRGP